MLVDIQTDLQPNTARRAHHTPRHDETLLTQYGQVPTTRSAKQHSLVNDTRRIFSFL